MKVLLNANNEVVAEGSNVQLINGGKGRLLEVQYPSELMPNGVCHLLSFFAGDTSYVSPVVCGLHWMDMNKWTSTLPESERVDRAYNAIDLLAKFPYKK